jgi:alpha-glucoside transport system permease protein
VTSAPPPPAPVLEPDELPPLRTTEPSSRRVLGTIAAFLAPLLAAVAIWSAYEWMRTTQASRALVVVVAVAVGVGGVFATFLGADRIVDVLPVRVREHVRPWVFVGPALVLLSVFLLYPAVNTIFVSFRDARGEAWVGLDNYRFVFTDPGMLRSIRNTAAWMVVVPLVSVAIGLVFAVLVDRLRRMEAVAKSLIFLPMAISFVGASIVWSFIYSFRAFGNQTGLLNGLWVGLGNDPVGWLSLQPWNNLFLMVIMIWMQTGFAMVILSAAIKSVPDELLEAARIDGASELQIFWRVIIPTIMSAIVVVTTTMVINVLKVFDIVWVMTSGEAGTEVIAERMIRWFFRNGHFGRGAAIAVVLFVAVVPVMVWNVRRFRAEEEIR